MAKASAVKKKVTPAKAVVPPRPRPEIPVQEIVRWVSEARPDKEIGAGMSFYKVSDGEIRATNGKMTASYPWMNDEVFLVAGQEFERVLGRMGDDVVIEATEATYISVRSEKFSAKIGTLPPDVWGYHGVEDAQWREVPDGFLKILKSLRAFIADNHAQPWQGCVAIDHGNMYATNNIALAGSACDVGDVQVLLSSAAIDFLLRRSDNLRVWHASSNYIAFKWESGAWMRVQCVEGKFPEAAAKMVRDVYELEPTQEITDEFRAAFADVSNLAENTIQIFSDRMVSRFKQSEITAMCACEVPPDSEKWDHITQKNKLVKGGVSIWGAAHLAPVISQATHWQPSKWPKPAPFRGDNIAGFIIGREA